MRRTRNTAAQAEQLAPFLKSILRSSGGRSSGGSGGGGALTAHDLGGEYHTGTLRTDQAPWAVTNTAFAAHRNTINAHLGLASNSGLTTSNSLLTLGTPGTLTATTSSSLSGTTHTHAITTTVSGNTSPNTILRSSSGGGLELAFLITPEIRGYGNTYLKPNGDVIFDPAGNDAYPYTNYDLNLGLINKKWLTLHAAELWVETLVAQDTIATIGGRILVAPTTTLIADLGTGDTTIDVKHNQMASGDRVYMEADGKIEFMAITSSPTTITDGYRYSVTRNLDGTGANQWYAGDAILNTGTTGNGFIDLYSLYGVPHAGQTSTQRAGPTIVGNVRLSSTFNDFRERWAIGSLNGLYDYGTEVYGMAAGDPTGAWIGVDATNGVRIMQDGSTEVIRLDASGNSYFAGVMTIGASGEIRQGTGTLGSNFTGIRLWRDTNVGRIGGYNNNTLQWYGATDGKLYFGAGAGVLDANGITVDASTGAIADINAYTFDSSGTSMGGLYASSLGGYNIYLATNATASADALTQIYAQGHASNNDASAILQAVTSSATFEAYAQAVVTATTGTLNLYADTNIQMTGDTNVDGELSTTGNLGAGTSSPTAIIDADGNTLRLRSARTPASASATGNAGDVCFDSNYMYRCVSTNTWKRVALSTW